MNPYREAKRVDVPVTAVPPHEPGEDLPAWPAWECPLCGEKKYESNPALGLNLCKGKRRFSDEKCDVGQFPHFHRECSCGHEWALQTRPVPGRPVALQTRETARQWWRLSERECRIAAVAVLLTATMTLLLALVAS